MTKVSSGKDIPQRRKWMLRFSSQGFTWAEIERIDVALKRGDHSITVKRKKDGRTMIVPLCPPCAGNSNESGPCTVCDKPLP